MRYLSFLSVEHLGLAEIIECEDAGRENVRRVLEPQT